MPYICKDCGNKNKFKEEGSINEVVDVQRRATRWMDENGEETDMETENIIEEEVRETKSFESDGAGVICEECGDYNVEDVSQEEWERRIEEEEPVIIAGKLTDLKNKFFGIVELKQGDKVKIKDDLVVGGRYDGIRFNSSMVALKGQTITIISRNNDIIKIKEDDGMWCWTKEMFDLSEDDKEESTKNTQIEKCDTCGKQILIFEYESNKGLCNNCVAKIN